jgi:hypothetical protein
MPKKKESLNLFGSSSDSIDPSQYGGVITSEGYKTYKKKKR